AFYSKQVPSPATLHAMAPERRAAIYETAYEFTRYRTQSDKLPREATANLSYSLLQARSRLGTPSGLTPPETPSTRDDEGHPTGRASLSGGRFMDRNFVEFNLRPAYHDLQDPSPGYRTGSQLQFLNAEFRYYLDNDELQLEQFNLVDILSLT